MQQPCGAHLVGSIPLDDAADVFRTVNKSLGSHLKRIPDGETGARRNWIAGLVEVFRQIPQVEEQTVDSYGGKRTSFRLKRGRDAREIRIPNLGYAAAARSSYATFLRLREAREIQPGMRFQVALPTPFALIHSFIDLESQATLEPAIESGIVRELQEVLTHIPLSELALQWDVAVEFAVLEGVRTSHHAEPERAIAEQLPRWGNLVPSQAELGYHLCYGDYNHHHFIEPRDTALLVQVANWIVGGLTRPLNWLHLPVPQSRDDPEYYRPLSSLSVKSSTEVYLGLLHYSDGAAGAEKRVRTAREFLPNFGVATECGFGRRPRETIGALLDLHAATAARRNQDDHS